MATDEVPDLDPRFLQLRRTGDRRLRDELIGEHLPLARAFARRYARRGLELEDLEQVARLGLIGAVDRFDPEVGVRFSTFAGRTIDGELKRWFRDRAWSVRVPRRSQDLGIAVRNAVGELSQQLGRSPTPTEVAERTGAEVDEVLSAMDASQAFRAESLDRPRDTRDDGGTLADALGTADSGVTHLDDRDQVERLLASLPRRERDIVMLRFFDELSQQQIADRVGISQMHVSRLLRQALATLRDRLDT